MQHKDNTVLKYIYKSKLGDIEIFVNEDYLFALFFSDSNTFDTTLIKNHETISNNSIKPSVLTETIHYLDNYFNGEAVNKTPKIKTFGSFFQEKVWEILKSIPLGKTMTYNELSKELEKQGIPSCPQAVGNAVKRNPVSIIIPCHRVIGTKGQLTGYAGGIERKTQLLEIEELSIRSGRIIS